MKTEEQIRANIYYIIEQIKHAQSEFALIKDAGRLLALEWVLEGE